MSGTAAYLTQARRLRQQYAAEPNVLHFHLCKLAHRQDVAHWQTKGNADSLQSRPTIRQIQAFAWQGDDSRAARRSERPYASRLPHLSDDALSAPTSAEVIDPAKVTPDSPFARAVVDWFADQVAGEFNGRLLHQSQRHALLKTAERLGIGRFHANLIIAVAQHSAETRATDSSKINPKRRNSRLPAIALALVIQALIIYGAWCVLHGI